MTVSTHDGPPGTRVSVRVVDTGPHLPQRQLVMYRHTSGVQDCVPSGSVYAVGTITWVGSIGTGTFVVPAAPPGAYLVEESLPEVQPPCMPVTPFTILTPNTASSQAPTPFAEVVARSRLIVLVTVHLRSDGGYSFDVEQVLKGNAPSRLVYAPTIAPPLDGWARAVIAFIDPTNLDYRAGTIAWHVAVDGRIDPERYQQFPGVPQTLDAMLSYFGLPATDTLAGPTSQGWTTWCGVALVLAGLAGWVLGVRRFRGEPRR